MQTLRLTMTIHIKNRRYSLFYAFPILNSPKNENNAETAKGKSPAILDEKTST